MAYMTSGQVVAEKGEVIRELCAKGMTDGANIWDALEANGIHTTPGVIYQAMGAASGKPALEAGGWRLEKARGATGLTAEDLDALTRIAVKAGGMESLMGVLGKMRRMLLQQAAPFQGQARV